MQYKDYYKILEVNPDATFEEIKKSYRRLALIYHPDRNQGNKDAEEHFKEINEAYDVLSDTEKRKTFDLFAQQKHNEEFYNKNKPTAESKNDEFFSNNFSGGYSEFFNNIFSRMKKSSLLKGDDYHGKLSISLQEAYSGSVRVLDVLNKKLRININPGISDDTLLKISGCGYPGLQPDNNGDLFVRVQLLPDKLFIRRGDELFTELFVDIYTVLLGGKAIIKTFKGDIRIDIPQGITFGKQLRVAGLGMPVYNTPGVFGDLFVKIKYLMPHNLSDEEIELLNKLHALEEAKYKVK